MKICAGKIEVESIGENTEKYNGNLMSDGERAIFHYIGEVVSAKDNSLIIIDEPENHLHNSILEKLWNEIEAERQDCVYLYITHNCILQEAEIMPKLYGLKICWINRNGILNY